MHAYVHLCQRNKWCWRHPTAYLPANVPESNTLIWLKRACITPRAQTHPSKLSLSITLSSTYSYTSHVYVHSCIGGGKGGYSPPTLYKRGLCKAVVTLCSHLGRNWQANSLTLEVYNHSNYCRIVHKVCTGVQSARGGGGQLSYVLVAWTSSVVWAMNIIAGRISAFILLGSLVQFV